jgi:3'-phosphoadenosine 5'-phosphosulfate sulfotransferase (PAPS reductase)/FAD synthetase
VKIKKSQERIKEWYEAYGGMVYVARSGGKDSDVLGNIVKNMYPNVPHIFINTGLEYDSVKKHGESESDRTIKPKKTFAKVIKDYGYPVISKEVAQTICKARVNASNGKYSYRIKKLDGIAIDKKTGLPSQYNIPQYKYLLDAPFRISHKCCDVMKKNPAKDYEKETGNKPFLGIMTEESRLRKEKWLKYGCNAFELDRPTSQPLSFWTEQDILQYIVKYRVELADAYGYIVYTDEDGMFYDEPLFLDSMKLTTTLCKRTGCIFCMFGIRQDTDRFLKLKEMEPEKYDYVMRGGKFDSSGMWVPQNGLGYKFVIDWLNKNGNLGIRY